MDWVTIAAVGSAIFTGLAAAFAGITAIVAVVALLYTRSQLRQAREDLDDRRLDYKVRGLIGENILLLNSLTEQARTAVAEAQTSMADAQSSVRVIQGAVRDAERILARLNDVATEAESDAERISRTLTDIDLRDQAREIMVKLRDEMLINQGRLDYVWTTRMLPDEPSAAVVERLVELSLKASKDGATAIVVTNRQLQSVEELVDRLGVHFFPVDRLEDEVRRIVKNR